MDRAHGRAPLLIWVHGRAPVQHQFAQTWIIGVLQSCTQRSNHHRFDGMHPVFSLVEDNGSW